MKSNETISSRPEIGLQLAAGDDVPMITELERMEDTKEFIIPYSREQHLANLSDEGFVYLIIVQADIRIGFIILVLDKDQRSVEFRRIAIAPAARGVGKLAIHAMEKFCLNELHAKAIWLDVFAFNERAIHAYQKLGYVKTGVAEFQNQTLWLFRKEL
jgi:RimJ/RimL family protein N-acetyltransferase